MKYKTLKEQVQLLFEIIQDANMTRHVALDFLCERDALARWGITNQDAVDIVYDSVADDGEGDYYE